jgi:hypothetical protein
MTQTECSIIASNSSLRVVYLFSEEFFVFQRRSPCKQQKTHGIGELSTSAVKVK